MNPITCSASCCNRTNISHPLNFRLRRRTGDPLCQAHYIQTKKVGFTEFTAVRDSGKEGRKYDKSLKQKKYVCTFCKKKYASASGLHYHHTYTSVKGVSECNRKHLELIASRKRLALAKSSQNSVELLNLPFEVIDAIAHMSS